MPSPAVERVLARLFHRRDGQGWRAKCPVHQDRNPSLTIREGDDGRVLLHCFRGCRTGDILQAIGLEWRHLFATPRPRRRG